MSKAEKSRRLHVLLQSYSLGEHMLCMHVYTAYDLYLIAATHNTPRRTDMLRVVGSLSCAAPYKQRGVAQHMTWSSIVSGLHNHTNAASRPQSTMQIALCKRPSTAYNMFRGRSNCTTHFKGDRRCVLMSSWNTNAYSSLSDPRKRVPTD